MVLLDQPSNDDGPPLRIKRQADEGLADHSRRPHYLAHQKFDSRLEEVVLQIRDKYNIGKIRISPFLFQQHSIQVSASTVARILTKHQREPTKRYRKNQPPIRYSRPDRKTKCKWTFARLSRVFITTPLLMIVADLKSYTLINVAQLPTQLIS
ncbi:hypothetical protein [Spirosoma arboris]|uniref:hypothetical protein n=1 Tax=Spirosoma arboris TaxID=2682092 RepID=UPI00293BE0B6|nr:hypothetical protein [Spirosoma arboris]